MAVFSTGKPLRRGRRSSGKKFRDEKHRADAIERAKRMRSSYADAQRGACGKLCFASKGVAKASMKNLAGKGPDLKPGTLSVYQCHRCQAWHVGHMAPSFRP